MGDLLPDLGLARADLGRVRCRADLFGTKKNQFQTISCMPFFIIVFIAMTLISCARLDHLCPLFSRLPHLGMENKAWTCLFPVFSVVLDPCEAGVMGINDHLEPT